MSENRDFKGVWIPKEIWLSENLNLQEKCLLVEIDSLSNLGKCYASNAHFAKFLGLSKDRISKLISGLVDKKYVEVTLTYKPGSKEIDERIITTIGYRQKQLGGIGKFNDTPIGKNNEENNTFINNTINNTINQSVNQSDTEEKLTDGQTDLSLQEIFDKSRVEMYESEDLKNNIKESIKELYNDLETRKTIIKLQLEHIDEALERFRRAKETTGVTKKKEYFKKCLISSILEYGFDNLF